MTNKLSVIIPIYNAEKYILNLCQNILNQTYQNYIVYLINDGSTDASSLIIDKVVSKDNRFKLTEKTNGGPSSARNVGIDMAFEDNSNYILFIDSDDYIDVDYFEKMIDLIERNSVDIVFASHYFNDNPKRNCIEKDSILNSFDSLCMILDDRIITSQSHHKIFRKELWKEIRFPLNMFFLEDTATIYKTIIKSEKCLISNYCGYHYNVSNSLSITKKELSNKYIISGWRSLYSIVSNDFDRYSGKEIKILKQKAKSLFMDNFLELYPRITQPSPEEKLEINFYFNKCVKEHYIFSYKCLNFNQRIKKIMFMLFPHLYHFLFRLRLVLLRSK